MEQKEFEIWSEGGASSDGHWQANFHGKQCAETFEEACDKLLGNNPNYGGLLSSDRISKIRSYYGCRLFDNEADARKSFG